MRIKVVSLTLIVLLASSFHVKSQQKTEPQFKLVEFQMALYKRAPEGQQVANVDNETLHKQHVEYIASLLESGKIIIAGPLVEQGDIRGVSIFHEKSIAEAKTLAESDPVVKAGHLIVEMHPWWSEEVMKKPSLPLKMTTAYLGFLVRGAKWTPEKTPQTEELQKAHLANINRLAEMKKLVVAGPFGDNGELRGIFVFKVGSLEEAKSLAATDPSVQAGRLAVNMYTWSVPEGILP